MAPIDIKTKREQHLALLVNHPTVPFTKVDAYLAVRWLRTATDHERLSDFALSLFTRCAAQSEHRLWRALHIPSILHEWATRAPVVSLRGLEWELSHVSKDRSFWSTWILAQQLGAVSDVIGMSFEKGALGQTFKEKAETFSLSISDGIPSIGEHIADTETCKYLHQAWEQWADRIGLHADTKKTGWLSCVLFQGNVLLDRLSQEDYTTWWMDTVGYDGEKWHAWLLYVGQFYNSFVRKLDWNTLVQRIPESEMLSFDWDTYVEHSFVLAPMLALAHYANEALTAQLDRAIARWAPEVLSDFTNDDFGGLGLAARAPFHDRAARLWVLHDLCNWYLAPLDSEHEWTEHGEHFYLFNPYIARYDTPPVHYDVYLEPRDYRRVFSWLHDYALRRARPVHHQAMDWLRAHLDLLLTDLEHHAHEAAKTDMDSIVPRAWMVMRPWLHHAPVSQRLHFFRLFAQHGMKDAQWSRPERVFLYGYALATAGFSSKDVHTRILVNTKQPERLKMHYVWRAFRALVDPQLPEVMPQPLVAACSLLNTPTEMAQALEPWYVQHVRGLRQEISISATDAAFS